MNKKITFHINNMAYTITIDESIEKELKKYLDINKNNDVKSLLIAYLKLSQEYMKFQQDVEDTIDKLSRF